MRLVPVSQPIMFSWYVLATTSDSFDVGIGSPGAVALHFVENALDGQQAIRQIAAMEEYDRDPGVVEYAAVRADQIEFWKRDEFTGSAEG